MYSEEISAHTGHQPLPRSEGAGQWDGEITDLQTLAQIETENCKGSQRGSRIWETIKNISGVVLSILLLMVTLLLSPIILPLAFLSVYIEKKLL